ncbi:MAG: leucine-rich repeat domain-containing protein, partial [Clostridia bacterium]|nr:leucine-rich repeat domain-containing protein [Clostridia bacterium]
MKLESVLIKVAIIILAVKALFILSTVIIIFAGIHHAGSSGKDDPENDAKVDRTEAIYTLNDGGGSYALSQVDINATEFVIPAEYNGLPVTAINRDAFYYVDYPMGCAGPDVYVAKLDSLTIPSSITEIKYGAFYKSDIKNIHYEGTIEEWCSISFGSSVFGEETSFYIGEEEVTDLTLPETLVKVESQAFSGYKKLTSLNLNLVDTVGSEAFACCHNLESVTAHNLKLIESAAFEDCPLLESFEINSSPLEKIGENAFWRCEKLYSFTLPENFISVGAKAFSGCTGLYDIYNFSNLNVIAGRSDNGNIAENALIVHTQKDDGLTLKIDDNFGWVLSEERGQLVKYFGEEPELILPEDVDGKQYDIRRNTFY